MAFSLIPRYSFRKITDISPDFLKELGIRFLMLDLDNTVAAYSESLPSVTVKHWMTEIKTHGIEVFIVSNSVRKIRVEAFAEALDVAFVLGASKPSPKGVILAMEKSGFSAEESALIGDQVYTDTLSANRAGVFSIIVSPRRFTNPFLVLRYALEVPFRVLCKNKM